MAHVEMVIDSLRTGRNLRNQRAVILKDKPAERYLPVYVGQQEADIIEKVLVSGKAPPSAYDKLALPSMDIALSAVDSLSVMIDRFENDVFYTKLLLTYGGQSYNIDCPCGKALALATIAGARLFVDEATLDKAGISVAP